jgi:hypothetical protein
LGSLSSPLSCVLCLLMASGYGIVRSARILEALRRVDRGYFVPGEVRREEGREGGREGRKEGRKEDVPGMHTETGDRGERKEERQERGWLKHYSPLSACVPWSHFFPFPSLPPSLPPSLSPPPLAPTRSLPRSAPSSGQVPPERSSHLRDW